MKNLRDISDNEIQKLCMLINEEYENHSFSLSEPRHLSIRLKYVETGGYKYLAIYENGLVELFTYHPSMVLQLRYKSVHALLLTDYLRKKGYEFTCE